MSNQGPLNRDGIFNNLQFGNNVIINNDRDACLNSIKVNKLKVRSSMTLGGIPVSTEWVNVALPDIDQTSWTPSDKTHYFQTNLTETRTLTISQASLNSTYPDAADGTIISFDFVFSNSANVTLVDTDLEYVYLNNMGSGPRTWDDIVHMKGGYVVKQAGVWAIVLPDIYYD